MSAFRPSFSFPSSIHHWYPGHMAKGMREMAKKIQKCDCVIEIQDARIPFSGRNPQFNLLVHNKPKILALNKIDLADPNKLEPTVKALMAMGEAEVIPVNCRAQHHSGVKEMITTIQRCLARWGRPETKETKVMVVGMPNVGKSSFINALRRSHCGKGKATRVGALPGMTRAVLTKITVSDDPLMYLVDTPGVMKPVVDDPEVALRLAITGMCSRTTQHRVVALGMGTTGMLKDHLIGEELLVDYLLYFLNKNQMFEYVRVYDMEEPSDDVQTTLEQIARRLHAKMPGGGWDFLRSAQHFLTAFRSGKLGRVTLDSLPTTA